MEQETSSEGRAASQPLPVLPALLYDACLQSCMLQINHNRKGDSDSPRKFNTPAREEPKRTEDIMGWLPANKLELAHLGLQVLRRGGNTGPDETLAAQGQGNQARGALCHIIPEPPKFSRRGKNLISNCIQVTLRDFISKTDEHCGVNTASGTDNCGLTQTMYALGCRGPHKARWWTRFPHRESQVAS